MHWWSQPSALVVVSADVPELLRWTIVTMAAGVSLSGLRDLYAAYELPHGSWPWR
jgi:hypothetical protein